MTCAYSPGPRVWTPGANQYVVWGSPKFTPESSPGATATAPAGLAAGPPPRSVLLPHTRAGGAAGPAGRAVLGAGGGAEPAGRAGLASGPGAEDAASTNRA